MRAWSYLVVSSTIQADTLDHQAAWAESAAQEHGWQIVRTFRGTSSGASGARKLLEQLLTELRGTPKAQRPDRVLMIRLDRTGRGLALEPLAALAEIYRLGVIVHTREDGDLLISKASDTLKPILRVLTGALENEARRDKALNAHERKRREGKHAGHPPYGVILQDGIPVPDEPRAAVVRQAFEMRAQGAGYERIAHALGPTAPPKLQADGSTRKMGWHRTFVRTMLCRQTYKGVVVDADLFDRVQLVKNSDFKERGVQKFPWPLSGVVKCTCGYAITGTASGGNCQRCKGGARKHNHQRIRYYLCNNPIAHPGKRPHVRADRVEAQFVALLKRLVASPDTVRDYRRQASANLPTLQENAKGLERDLAAIDARRRSAWDLQADGVISKDELAQRLAELRAEHDAASARLAQVRHTITLVTAEQNAHQNAAEILYRISEAWAHSDAGKQKGLARLVAQYVGGIMLGDDGKLLVECDGSPRNICEQMIARMASHAFMEQAILSRI
jgi:DNA invertase Pin-like site-specific DNA recombinase